MPVMTSLMVLILSSVRAAVLLLRGQTWDEPQWPQPNFPQQQQGVQGGTKDRWFPTALLCWHHRRTFSKCKWRKILLGSQPVSLIQEVTWRTPSTGWGRPEVSQVQSLRLRSQLSREGKKTLSLMGRQCLCGDKIVMNCWGAEKIGLLIPLGKESKKRFRDLAALQQSLEG